MFNFLTVLFDRSHMNKKWDAPQHWSDHQRLSAYDRQKLEAERHRLYLIRDRNGMW
ncbi:MAG: hypothetical protein AAFQ64_02350 [Pseudomonadota bacterium]